MLVRLPEEPSRFVNTSVFQCFNKALTRKRVQAADAAEAVHGGKAAGGAIAVVPPPPRPRRDGIQSRWVAVVAAVPGAGPAASSRVLSDWYNC